MHTFKKQLSERIKINKTMTTMKILRWWWGRYYRIIFGIF
jgi:hypothetical protein